MSAAIAPDVTSPAPAAPAGKKRGPYLMASPAKEGQAVCRRVARGQLLKTACQAVGIPRRTFRQWVEDDPDGFGKSWERARLDQAHALAEETLKIADGRVDDMAQVQRNRLRVDARKWYVGKIAPALYGERVEHSHSHVHGVVMLPAIAGHAQAGHALAMGTKDAQAIGGREENPVLSGSQDPARAFGEIARVPAHVLALPDVTEDSESFGVIGVSPSDSGG